MPARQADSPTRNHSWSKAIARLCKAQNFLHVGEVAIALAAPDGRTGIDGERNLVIALTVGRRSRLLGPSGDKIGSNPRLADVR